MFRSTTAPQTGVAVCYNHGGRNKYPKRVLARARWDAKMRQIDRGLARVESAVLALLEREAERDETP
jgi:hypothetical protein